MNEPFVPLSHVDVSGQNRTDFRVTIVNEAGNLRPFHSFGHAGSKPDAGVPCEPCVTLQRDGERLSAIVIQCSCGQVIELACVYEKAK